MRLPMAVIPMGVIPMADIPMVLVCSTNYTYTGLGLVTTVSITVTSIY